MKFLIFGTGEYYSRYKIWFDRRDILALIDNSKEKQGQYVDGIRVISPEDVPRYAFDAVVILSFYVKDMKAQLIDLGVEESKIFHFFDLHGLRGHLTAKREVHFYGCGREDKSSTDDSRTILLLSHDLTLGGPALALYHAAQVLRKNGYQTVYGSMLDGPLRKILLEEEIPVIVDENLMVETMEETGWVGGYSLIICNTVNFHVFLSERDRRIPVAWWLHDALFFYDGIRREVMEGISPENMHIWSVGPIPERAVKTFRPDFHVEDLLYGVTDQIVTADSKKSNNVMLTKRSGKSEPAIWFITIGYIEHRKGQDLLLEAISNLASDLRKSAEFLLVGQNTSLMAQELMASARDIPEIVVTGPVGREEIDMLLEQSDILVCPSREDPMPTVAAEAMMHGVPCLLSDSVGTVKYIRDGSDGLVFQSGNTEQLVELLSRCIQGCYDLDRMGRNARKVFEKYFSMQAFERQFLNLVEEMDHE